MTGKNRTRSVRLFAVVPDPIERAGSGIRAPRIDPLAVIDGRRDRARSRDLRTGRAAGSNKPAFGRVLEPKSGSPLFLAGKVLACIQTNAAMHRSLLLMEWSGRAPAPPAIEAGKGRQRQGARRVSELKHHDHDSRHVKLYSYLHHSPFAAPVQPLGPFLASALNQVRLRIAVRLNVVAQVDLACLKFALR